MYSLDESWADKPKQISQIVKDTLTKWAPEEMGLIQDLSSFVTDLVRDPNKRNVLSDLISASEEAFTSELEALSKIPKTPEEYKRGLSAVTSVISNVFSVSGFVVLAAMPKPPGLFIAVHKILQKLSNGRISLIPSKLFFIFRYYHEKSLVRKERRKSFGEHAQIDELTLKRRPLTDFEKRNARRFQVSMKIFATFQAAVMNKETLDVFFAFDKLKDLIAPFKQEPWFSSATDWIQYKEDEIKDHRKKVSHYDTVTKNDLYAQGMKAAEAGLAAFIAFGKSVGNIEQAAVSKTKGSQEIFAPAKHLNNPFYLQNSLFFGSNGFVSQFDKGDIDYVINLDLNSVLTAYDFPFESEDYQHVVYWFMKLTETDEDYEVPTREFDKSMVMRYPGNKDLELMIKLVKEYLSNNKKKSLLQAMSMIGQFPELQERLDQLKSEIRTVYRGVPVDEYGDDENYVGVPSEEDILEEDRNRKYVATSVSSDVARRFILWGGAHIIKPRDERSGYMITYEVNPESIVFDTRLFGGKFSEEEIVIDATKSEPINIVFVEGNREDDEYYDDDEEDIDYGDEE